PDFNTANGALSHIHSHADVSAYVADLLLKLIRDTTEHIGHKRERLLEPGRRAVEEATTAAAVAATLKDTSPDRHGGWGGHSPVNVGRVIACACVEAVGAAAIANDSAVLKLTSEAWAINKLHGAWGSVRNIVSQT